MRTKTLDQLASLQKNPSNVRNICILAHVDHGKTTLADALVASNGIISQRMAGKLRYMDSREDEQERGITMKSSAISLFYQKDEARYLINLIDSPGHVDFSSEVSTAVRLCDGAVVLVDVVEGVCPQTHAVLRQAWLENIKPVLVLNKIDRLVLELKMSPLEAHMHLQQILEQVNLLTNELFTSEAMEKTSTEIDKLQRSTSREADPQCYDWTTLEDEDENMENKNIYFSPDQDNVVFASALDGWGFRISHFAELWAQKLGMSHKVLQKTLWGDYYLNVKNKRVMKGAQSKGKKPLFVQFVLEQIWAVYDSIVISRDKEKTDKIVKSLKLKVLARDAKHNDPRVHLQAVTSQWLPVSSAVLAVVVDTLPSPLQMTEERVEKLMCSHSQRFDSLPEQTQHLKPHFLSCNPTTDTPVIVFVSKMFPVERRQLPHNKQRPLTEEELQIRRDIARKRHAEKMASAEDCSTEESEKTTDTPLEEVPEAATNGVAIDDVEASSDLDGHVFVAFARVFSGTVKKGCTLYVLGPKHDPEKVLDKPDLEGEITPGMTVRDLSSSQHITRFTVQDLYLFMGRELEEMEEIPAGNILGIGGLDDHILKSGTISSTVACPSFTEMFFDADPIVRVAIEPAHPGDMAAVIQGLKLLNQADPCVQVLVQETGEHVIITAGEVHLHRCIEDLQERYAKVEVSASAPIVPFRETIIEPPKIDRVNEAIQDQNQPIKSVVTRESEKKEEDALEEGLIEVYTSNRKCVLHVRAAPLPESVTCLLNNHPTIIKTLDQNTTARINDKSECENEVKMNTATIEALNDLKAKLKKEFEHAGDFWKDAVDQMWSFGPRRNGPNILLNRIPGYQRPSVWSSIEKSTSSMQCRNFDSSVVNGFQMATLSGPLCDEPMVGVCFVVKKWDYVTVEGTSLKSRTKRSAQPQVNGEVKVNSRSRTAVDCDETLDCDSTEEDSHVSKQKQVAFGPFSGQLMSCMRDGCRRAYQAQPQRLSVAMYKCTIQATTEVLGKLYAVLGKRNGRVMSEEMREGTQIFSVEATLPIIESFGFAQDIRKKTSGLASPQLTFSHWETLDIDPFWTPTTEEEYTHFGEKADSDNRARMYMNKVRKRKGLKVDEKIVEHGEKQRTLTKMK
ncbi:elongation factor-like GTPase 1 [Haliotis rufescens]|uniref:elongation factor-like GTPase 1 n=1 Tax=Haliotis rufescens TaxID=6454 RepID=UPI001EB02D0E|nr:elongation factor-like GTPase 1 [Haliotis rufescens]